MNTKIKQRDSNIELLRIVAMLLVLMLHGTYWVTNSISMESVASRPFWSINITFIEALTLVAVNAYVIVSGYFGIKPKLKGIISLLFIIYYCRAVVYAFYCCLLGGHFEWMYVFKILNPFGGEWFVSAYLCLYCFAYVLDGFASSVTRCRFQIALILMMLLVVAGWILPQALAPALDYDSGGYVYSFMVIYLIGRYMRLHCDLGKYRMSVYIGSYVGQAAANTILFLGLTLLLGMTDLSPLFDDWFLSYNSLLVIVGAVSLFGIFYKLRISSRAINWIAKSVFSVYLLHCNDIILPYYLDASAQVREWGGVAWLPALLVFVLAVFVVCVCVDQPRRLLWTAVMRLISPNR